MPRTETDIANMASDWLDVDPIGDLSTDQGPMGRIYRRNYLESVKTVIREFPWNCATGRMKITQIPSDNPLLPIHETDDQYAYYLPADSLGPIDINGRPIEEITHQVENLVTTDGNGDVVSRRPILICTEPNEIILRYKQLIGAADMDPHLAKAVAVELGIRCVMKAANSSSKLDLLERIYTRTTKGDTTRRGGFQINSVENNPKQAKRYPSLGARARAGDV